MRRFLSITPLVVVTLGSGCLFFDATVYCDTPSDCPEQVACLSDGTCDLGGPPAADAGPRDDAGPGADAGPGTDAGPSADAGPDGGDEPDAGPPTAPTVEIAPTTPTTVDDLVATVVVDSTDPLDQAVSYTWAWFKNDDLEDTLTSAR
jgi:hypothetical protein